MLEFCSDLIDLKKIHDSGQSFRWVPIGENAYIVPHLESVCIMTQLGPDCIEIQPLNKVGVDWINYLDGYRNYKGINHEILKQEPLLRETVEYGKGIRLLRQDPFEMLITFIISANNHIPRIRNFIKTLSSYSGIVLAEAGADKIYAFPQPEDLRHLKEEDFRQMGAGYRAPYLVETIKMVLASDGFKNLDQLESGDLVKHLMTYKGVGRKVADCIALFGYGRWDVFPVDTWIKKAASEEWGIKAKGDVAVLKALQERFPVARGLVQQYMFYMKRQSKLNKG